MYPLIRAAFVFAGLHFVSLNCIAGSESVRPVMAGTLNDRHIVLLDSLLNYSVSPASVTNNASAKEADISSSRICSCQVLNLESSNYDHRSVVLLSEKANDGSSAAYTAATNRLQKEKNQMKKLFYDKIKVVSSFQGAGSCKSMYLRLRSTDKNLQLYEILNAD